MISGTRRPSRIDRRALLWCAVLGIAPLQATAQTAFDLEALFALLGRGGSKHATFSERKFIKQLDGPVDSSGEVSFDPPATMVMRTLKPRPETLRLDGRTITMERGRQSRTFRLDDHPEIAVYVEAVRAALAGDRAALERHHAVDLEGVAESWKLRLTPKDARLAAQVETIVLSGVRDAVRQAEVRLADGDYSVMNIEPASVRPPR